MMYTQIHQSENTARQRQREHFESNKRKITHHLQGKPNNITPDFSSEARETIRLGHGIVKVLKNKTVN